MREQSEEVTGLREETDSLRQQLAAAEVRAGERSTRLEQDMVIVKAALVNCIHTHDGQGGHLALQLQNMQNGMERQIRDNMYTLMVPIQQLSNEVQSLKAGENHHVGRGGNVNVESTTLENHQLDESGMRRSSTTTRGNLANSMKNDAKESSRQPVEEPQNPLLAVLVMLLIALAIRYS